MSELPRDERFRQGVDLFNQREFYRCHDQFEELWHEAVEPDRQFLQGVLQIAVGLYHLSNGNGRGARILVGEGIGRLADYHPDYAGLRVDCLLEQARDLLTRLQQAADEPEPVGAIAASLGLGPGQNGTERCPVLRSLEPQPGPL